LYICNIKGEPGDKTGKRRMTHKKGLDKKGGNKIKNSCLSKGKERGLILSCSVLATVKITL